MAVFGRWRMNTAVILPVTTTTCATLRSCSGITLVRRWCSSPQMELGSATSSVAQYKVSTLLLTLGQVCVWSLVSAMQFTIHIDCWLKVQ